MLSTIFKKELLDQLISPKFLIVSLLCLVLIPPSVLMNYKNYKSSFIEYEFLKKDYKDTQKILHLPPKVFRKPSILSTYGLGLERVLPKIIVFKKYQFETKGTGAGHEILSNITGKIDFVIITSFLLGLFAILYASTLIVSEKEAGTLKLVLANKTKRNVFILGKFLAGYTILIIPLLISFLISLLLLFYMGFPLFSNENFSRILSVFLLSLLYLSTYFALGLFISTRTHKSSIALMVSFLIWIFLTFVIPKISEPLANFIHPIQSDEVMMMKRRQLRNQIELEKGKKLAPLAQKYIWEARDFERYRKEREPIAKEYEEKIEKALQEFDRQYQREKTLTQN